MSTLPLQLQELPLDGIKVINNDCYLRNTDGIMVLFVKDIPLITYDIDDIATTRLVMVQLVELKLATQIQVAKAFSVERITISRQLKKYREQGIAALIPKKAGPKGPPKTGGKKEKIIVKLKNDGKTNQEIAQRLGTSESAIRNALKRIGYEPPSIPIQEEFVEIVAHQPSDETSLSNEPHKDSNIETVVEFEDDDKKVTSNEPTEPSEEKIEQPANNEVKVNKDFENAKNVELPTEHTLDSDPSNRTIDRFLARLGLLDNAAPLFQTIKQFQFLCTTEFLLMRWWFLMD
jgi:transposase